MCGLTFFGRLPAHHQERTAALGASGFIVGAWRLERWWSWSDRLRVSGVSPPIIRSIQLHWEPLVLSLERGGWSVGGRGLAGYVFRASPRPSSGAYSCTVSLWFYRWREAVGALLVVVWQVTCLGRLPAHHQVHTAGL
jgi:hypothetical protein